MLCCLSRRSQTQSSEYAEVIVSEHPRTSLWGSLQTPDVGGGNPIPAFLKQFSLLGSGASSMHLVLAAPICFRVKPTLLGIWVDG